MGWFVQELSNLEFCCWSGCAWKGIDFFPPGSCSQFREASRSPSGTRLWEPSGRQIRLLKQGWEPRRKHWGFPVAILICLHKKLVNQRSYTTQKHNKSSYPGPHFDGLHGVGGKHTSKSLSLCLVVRPPSFWPKCLFDGAADGKRWVISSGTNFWSTKQKKARVSFPWGSAEQQCIYG